MRHRDLYQETSPRTPAVTNSCSLLHRVCGINLISDNLRTVCTTNLICRIELNLQNSIQSDSKRPGVLTATKLDWAPVYRSRPPHRVTVDASAPLSPSSGEGTRLGSQLSRVREIYHRLLVVGDVQDRPPGMGCQKP
eukprot:3392054-Rhodomonas_salina.1